MVEKFHGMKIRGRAPGIAFGIILLALLLAGSAGAVSMTVASAPSVITDPEIAQYDANNDGIIQKNEAVQAEIDYFNNIIQKHHAVKVVMAYFSAATGNVSTGTVTRSFSVAIIAINRTLIVTLTPSPSTTFDAPGYQVNETVPAGFTVTANTAGNASNISNVWTFTNIGSAAFTYNLTAPAATGNYTFSGRFRDENADTGNVSGRSNVTIVDNVVQLYDTNHNGRIDKSEAFLALNDYLFERLISKTDATSVLVAYFS